jgi:hypothetical protein
VKTHVKFPSEDVNAQNVNGNHLTANRTVNSAQVIRYGARANLPLIQQQESVRTNVIFTHERVIAQKGKLSQPPLTANGTVTSAQEIR